MPRGYDSRQPLADWNPLASKLNYDTTDLQKQAEAALQNAGTQFWNFMIEAVDDALGIDLPGTLTGSSDSVSWLTSLTTSLFGGGATSSPTSWEALLAEIIPGLDASKITSGTFSISMLPLIPQSQITSLEASLDALLPNSTWQTFINGVVGGTAGDVNALISYINAVDTAAVNAVNTGDWNGLLTALFGGTAVASTVQPGAVPGLDASKITSGSFAQSFVTGLTSSLNALLPTTTYQSLVDGLANALGHTGTSHTWTDIETYFGIIPGGNIGSAIPATVVPGLDASKITSGSFAQSMITGLTTSLNTLLPTTTYQSLVDGLANALGHSGTGHTWTDIETYFGIIPGGNIGSAIPATVVPGLDASKIISGSFAQSFVTGLTSSLNALLPTTTYQSLVDGLANALGHTGTSHTWTDIETYFGIIPGGNIGSAVPASVVPGLDASKIISGLFPSSMVNAVLTGGTNLGTDLSSVVSVLFGGTAKPTVGQQVSPSAIPGVQGITTVANTIQNTWDGAVVAVAQALGLDTSTWTSANNPLSTLQNVLGQHASQTSAALTLASNMSDTLGGTVIPFIPQPMITGPAPTQVAMVAPLTAITGTQVVTGSTGINQAWASFTTFAQATAVDSYTFIAALSSASGAPTSLFVNFYSVNPTTGALTRIYASANLISSVPSYPNSTSPIKCSWLTFALPSELSFNAGDTVCVEFVVVNTSGSLGVQVAMVTQLAPPFPSKYPNTLGALRTPTTPQPTSLAYSALTGQSTAPWVGFNGPGAVYQYPVLRKVTTSQSITAPAWARFADVIPLGGGASGGGGVGFPGMAGSPTVVSIPGHSITAPGGSSGPNSTSFTASDAIGQGAPTETFNGESFPGSSNVATQQAGSAPGGGGGGGTNGAGAYGVGGVPGTWNPVTWSLSGGETFTITIGAGGPAPSGQSVLAQPGAAGLAYIVFRAS